MEKKEKSVKNEKETTELVKVNKKDKENLSKKWLAKTSLTVLLIAIIIAVYIGINLLVEKIAPTDIDLTKDKVYSLSEASKTFTKSIENDVEIMLINMNQSAKSVVEFAHKYSKENEKIKVKEIDDVSKYPEIANEYNLTDTTTVMIIKSGNKEKVLTLYDLTTLDYTTGEYKDKTEEAMTNAILDVTVTEKPKIYYLSNHTKYSSKYITYFIQSLANEANDVAELDLLTTGKVPDDASVLMITTLAEDMTVPERDAILNYIGKGGKIIIFSDPNVGKISLPNFQKILDEYGVGISEGIMVEQDANKMLSGSPSAILVNINSSSSIMNQTDMNMNACLMNSGKLTFKDEETLEKLKVEVETIATTNDTAFYRKDLSIESTAKQKNDEEGSQTVGALLTKTIDENKTSKLIIYSNNMFITNVEISVNTQQYLYALDFHHNKDIALNSIAYLTGRDDTITIRKDTGSNIYTITEQQKNIILTIIFSVPALIIVAGIVVWQIRRRKK